MPLLRINRQPSRSQLLVFALACLVAGAVVAFTHATRGHASVAIVVSALAVLPPVLWFVSPVALRWLFLALSFATYPVGFVLSYVVLAIMYYLVFTPVGLVMRAFGRDPLARRFDRPATTYWEARSPRASPAEYLRQR